MQAIRWVNRLVIVGFFILSAQAVNAQNGKVSGTVSDENNKPVIGASVKVLSLNIGVATDVDGHFELTLPSGKKYEIEISAVGFGTKTLTDVEVTAVQVNNLNIALVAKSGNLENVTVKTSARKESTNALITFQKNTNAVAQVISAEAIRRSPDKNTGEALKRVTGLSIQEGRYIVVRGLSDRYNQAMLNGVLLSSTEPDRKTFSFDIFPAAIVENIIVNKTFIPEYSGEWAGGLIQVNTRDIPAKGFFNISIGTNFNTNTIGKDIYTYPGGKLDFLGIDDGSRALPNGFPTKNAFGALDNATKTQLGVSLAAKSWAPELKTSFLNTLGQSFQANGGFVTKLFKKDLGGVVTVTYNRSVKNLDYQNSFFNINDNKADASFIYQNNKYTQDVLWGALANFSLRLNTNNKISFKNLINVNTSDYATLRTGKDYEFNSQLGENIKAYEYGFRNNTFFNTQLNGEHNMPSLKSKFNWFGSFSILDQYIPQQRRIQYNQDPTDPNAPYLALLSNTLSQKTGSVYYSNLNDYIYNFGGDITNNFTIGGKKQSIKAGYNFQVKDRLFNARPFSISLASDNPTLRALDPSQIFAAQNFGPADNQFHFDELSGIYFRYLANTILNAGYIQFDNNLTDKLRVVWGVRYENYDQLVGSTRKSDPRYSYSKVGDFLPAINTTYKLSPRSNLRFAVSQTVVRPEFRELTGTAFYDFEVGATIIGNPNLERTKVSNIDLRYEIYQRPGELFTLGAFYKYFNNPIELAFNQTGAGSSSTFNYLDNDKTSAQTYGAEIEFRKKLDFMQAFKRFTLAGNFSYIYNRVKFDQQSLNRPMQGQSPYLINASMQYDVEEAGLYATLLFNEVGRRILYVGNEQLPPVWEAPRPLLDLQIAKKIMDKKGELKLNISDLLNQKARYYHDLDGSKKYNSVDALALSRNYGTNVSLSFAYNFK
ncbi:outer membrane beta-barrel protein [Panacibacter ginsenosidivorans]|uniref:Outer membrane beta-barrel protein n=1 Tax=Panacibacter ginsenosidivorans TaxID=1813871 RepID=A0A5B8V975_9BACT|nr:TonB-dependent receptor [Panacibacter ginsenosidivorans]QEC68070.1 outer membrane beta-barrel protein [Panacibacter ginsenosidivorans]